MPTIFSRKCQYGIRALAYLTLHQRSGLCRLEKIAKAEQIPQAFLGKILQDLTHKRLVRSAKGVNGGFALAQPPEKITLYSVVNAIDNLSLTEFDCVLGRGVCAEENPCPLHHYWKNSRADQMEFLRAVTLQQLCALNGHTGLHKLVDSKKAARNIAGKRRNNAEQRRKSITPKYAANLEEK